MAIIPNFYVFSSISSEIPNLIKLYFVHPFVERRLQIADEHERCVKLSKKIYWKFVGSNFRIARIARLNKEYRVFYT